MWWEVHGWSREEVRVYKILEFSPSPVSPGFYPWKGGRSPEPRFRVKVPSSLFL